MVKSNYEEVRDFTEESSGIKCPLVPERMSKEEVVFLIKMVLSEMVELGQTVTESYDEAQALVTSCIGVDPSKHENKKTDIEVIADQGDAMVDAWYYMLNAASKRGIDLSKIFDEVHSANMRKKDPETETFKKRDDGKILKPKDWKPADIVSLVSNMGK